MQRQENNQVSPAGFFVRFAAYLLDSLLIGMALLIITVPAGLVTLFYGENVLTKPVLFQYSILAIVTYFLRALYFTLCTWSGGQTLGKRMFCIKVVSVEGAEKLTFFNALYRETIGKFLSGVSLYIGYLMLGADREKKALHDILCDTRVIYSIRIRKEVRVRMVQDPNASTGRADIYSWNGQQMQNPPNLQNSGWNQPQKPGDVGNDDVQSQRPGDVGNDDVRSQKPVDSGNDELQALQIMLLKDPESGPIMEGTGEFEK